MLKQIINTFFIRILTGIVNLVIAVIISNLLGAEGKGIQGLVITTISLIIVFTGIIGSGGLTYMLPRVHLQLLLIPSFIWSLLIVLIIWVGLIIIPLVPKEFIQDVVCLSFLLSVFNINNSLLVAHKKIERSNMLSLIQIITTLLVIIYVFIVKSMDSVHGYIIALYVGYSVSLIFSFLFTYNYYIISHVSQSLLKYYIAFKQLVKYGGFNQLDILAQFLSFRLAYYLLNYYIDPSMVGIYSNGVSIVESIWLLSRSISFVLHSQLVNSRNIKSSVELTIKFIKLSLLLALFGVLVIVLIPSDFYRFVFGPEFGDIRKVVISLSPGILFFSISFILSAFFSGTGRHYINSISSIVGLIAIVVFSLILIPIMGIVGAGLAASISYILTTIIKLSYFKPISGFNKSDLWYKKSDIKNIKLLLQSLFSENNK